MPGTTRKTALTAAIVATLSITAASASSQNNPAPSAAGPTINAVAPDFTLAAATRYGVLRDPVRLSDFRGRTVVLAFFFQARTKG